MSDTERPAIPETPKAVTELLRARRIRPNRRMGQNFLCDRGVRDAVVSQAGVRPGDLVLEVGAGLGMLTMGILAAGATVVAVELDRALHAFLTEAFAGEDRLHLIEGDVLDHGAISGQVLEVIERHRPHADRYLVVSNLPYSAGTPFVAATVALPSPPDRMLVMVQWEVALRMTGRPGSRDYGPLAVLLDLRGEATIVREVGGTVFVPITVQLLV